MLVLALAIATSAALQQPSPHLYKDWIAGCDNIRTCQANALTPPDGADNYLMLTITRTGTPRDSAQLNLPLPYKTVNGARFALRVDGIIRAVFAAQGADTQTIALTRPLLAAVARGHRAALFDAHGRNVGEASLAGLAAALLYIDARQHRLGTFGALKATGMKPDTRVSAPPEPPLIETPAPSAKPPRRISVALATKLIGRDAATCGEYARGKVQPRSYRLDASNSLVLIDHPCDGGAYNFFTSVYVMAESGPPRLAVYDAAPEEHDHSGLPGTGELTNGDWDSKLRQISSNDRLRGVGDCGAHEGFAWDGKRFRLVEYAEMGECRGSKERIRTWIARTNR